MAKTKEQAGTGSPSHSPGGGDIYDTQHRFVDEGETKVIIGQRCATPHLTPTEDCDVSSQGDSRCQEEANALMLRRLARQGPMQSHRHHVFLYRGLPAIEFGFVSSVGTRK